ncbi:hypothetical protein B0H17DRAFT_1265603 [Mycena rosella]|uniref:Uncharacterized protein n=1 Tax=Mycena rosella TaxID=1033263 RepID=A0AAD7CNY1_MYCRO|nr:hypothetical protein B0H17DRAFT_1265603 [Mycena rosella]
MPTFKVVVVVGKTSLRGQHISARFSTPYRATIGADFITKTLRPRPRPTASPPPYNLGHRRPGALSLTRRRVLSRRGRRGAHVRRHAPGDARRADEVVGRVLRARARERGGCAPGAVLRRCGGV